MAFLQRYEPLSLDFTFFLVTGEGLLPILEETMSTRGIALLKSKSQAEEACRMHLAGRAIALVLLSLSLLAPSVRAQYMDLYDFGECGCPSYTSLMAQGRDGNLYGITPSGGVNNVGVVFKAGPFGGYTILHDFDTVHGSTPVGGLTLGVDGNLYGTTEEGGANGYGNIFRITPAGAFTVIYDFTGAADGGFPVAPLTLTSDGSFYGTSYPAVAFRVSLGGDFKVIGTIPTTTYGALVQAHDGNLYGTTEFGGTYSAGTVYQIAGGKVTTLYSFDGPHGSFPVGGLAEGADGYLYGTTTAGGDWNAGVIYRISTTGEFNVMMNWDSVHYSAGYQAYAGLVAGADGYLYGTTIWGGLNGVGTIFQLATDGAYSVLYNFDTPTGGGAYATPMQHTSGQLFGMTKRGGAAGNGVIYSLDDGLEPFVGLLFNRGAVGTTVGILGYGFAQASSVDFNGTPASFHVISNTYMTATVPSGETGFVAVETASGTLISNKIFRVTPEITGFSPPAGEVGSTLTIKGTGLIQTTKITIGGVAVQAYNVNSDSELTAKVPAGAKTGDIVVTTPGGTATSSQIFTVVKLTSR